MSHVPPLSTRRRHPLEVWLGRVLSSRYMAPETVPESLTHLVERLAEAQDQTGYAKREVSAKPAE